MARDDDIARAIRQRDVDVIVRLMIDGSTFPSVKTGFRTEGELWDYKPDCPPVGKESANAWAHIAKDVLGFHNQKGGLLIFGITEEAFVFCGATTRLDSKLVNDQLRKYLGDKIWVEYHREYIQADQRYLGIALVPPRGPTLERFRADAPMMDDRRLFSKGDSAIREADSTRVLRREEADALSRNLSIPTLGKIYSVDESDFRILQPEYVSFVEREEPCRLVESALHDPRTAITSLVGIGGVGKTALATWAVLRAYEAKSFPFIVSMTAKDRELTSTGIQALEAPLTSFESLLDSILDVLGLPDIKVAAIARKEQDVRDLLTNSNGLLYVDNLETIDDPRIIRFLDNLPVGTRAIVTSRRASVRVSVHPVDLGPLTNLEVTDYIASLTAQPGLAYVADLTPAECARIGNSCDRIPLAIRWALARSQFAAEALAVAESITSSGRRGEEILEFCFRRVFENMINSERDVVQVLSLFNRPITTEALVVGTRLPEHRLLDAVEQLISDALVQRLFDSERNDYCFTLLPITRAFVYSQVSKDQNLERTIRATLTDWYEARDVSEPGERLIVREVRQGRSASESALVDLATAAQKRGDNASAQALYQQALQRNPSSWRAARLYAEFIRHKLDNQAEALQMYEQAAANAPRRGEDRALIFREWGMLLRNSGLPDATDLAVEKFEAALSETPNDVITIHALAHMLGLRGAYLRVIELLEPLVNHHRGDTRRKTYPLLLEAYERTNDIVKAAQLRQTMHHEAPSSHQ